MGDVDLPIIGETTFEDMSGRLKSDTDEDVDEETQERQEDADEAAEERQ